MIGLYLFHSKIIVAAQQVLGGISVGADQATITVGVLVAVRGKAKIMALTESNQEIVVVVYCIIC